MIQIVWLQATDLQLIPGTDTPALDIAASFEWPMEVVDVQPVDEDDRLKIGGCVKGEVLQIRSIDPIRETSAGALRLQLRLTTLWMRDPDTADRTFRDILLGADPDMGLSYAWDALVATGDRVYHLHAGCVLSEEHFGRVADALERAVESEGGVQRARCRCGGGCLIVED
jgi:hypothetical protein